MKNVLVTDFSGMLEAEGFLPWLASQGAEVTVRDWREMEGTNCYCDEAARAQILALLPESLPRLRWIDTGDYHYMSHLLATRQKEPFHLVLLDHHPDDQEPAFGGVLSCGSWVREMRRENPMLRDMLSIGPDECPSRIPEGWIEGHAGERVYLSLDKDVMDRAWARTDWSQGTHSLEQVQAILREIIGRMDVVALDICGGITPEKGGTPEDMRINLETDIALYKFLSACF
jgi:hypothetical protein